MTKTQHLVWLAAGAVWLSAASANAQVAAPATEKIFVNVNFGGQFASRTLTTNVNKTVYDEAASLSASQEIGSGMVFDVTGGYRVWNDVYVGLAITHFGNTQAANYTASIADPLHTDRFTVSTGSVDDLKRTEVGVDPFVLWVTPLFGTKIDLSVALGAAFINTKQDSVTDFTVAPQASVPTIAVVTEKVTAKGVYANVDFIYSLAPRYGVGGFVRYAGGKAKFPIAGESDAGGLQAGGGIRFRF